MKHLKQITLIGLIIVLTSSCAKVFYTPDARSLAAAQKSIAIVPPKVAIAPRRKVDPQALKEQQITESLNFQKEIHSWLLKRKMQGKILQEIQDVETTNALLERAGYPKEPLTPNEICGILGVDGIITSNFNMSKPMSEGAAVAIGLLVGVWGATNEVAVTMGVNDCSNNKQIFNYNHKYSGGVGSTSARLVDDLMRNASKKMPYIKK